MNEKEFNLQVLAKLVGIANIIFAKLTINKEGTYTAAELWSGKNSLGEPIAIDYHGTKYDTYTVEVGTFKCSFTPEKIFYLIWKFEQLCKVRQENKARFTYGVAEHEIINGKAMYLGKDDKVVTRKKPLLKVSDRVAFAIDRKTKTYEVYFLAAGVWYLMSMYQSEAGAKRIQGAINSDPDKIKKMLSGWNFENGNKFNAIYKALRDVLCAEVIKDTPEERKTGNKPENTVVHEVVTGKAETGALHVEQREVKTVGNGLYKDADNLYFEHGKYLYILGGYTRGVASFLKEQTDIKAKIVSMIEEGGISAESTKLLYKKLTGHKFGGPAKVEPKQEESHEDYPPEPYNKTGEASCNEEAEITPERKDVRTTFSRQKVFPTELYYARRKIRRYKPFSCLRYTNYHYRGESGSNQTGSGKSGGYSVVTIRGSAKRKGKINSLSP